MSYPVFRMTVLSLFLFCAFAADFSGQNLPKTGGMPAEFEQALLKEINEVRANPLKYISYLEEYKRGFRGNTAYLPNGQAITTNEGIAAVDDAIAFLKSLKKLPPYTVSKGLLSAANSQLADLQTDSSLGHYGKDGKSLPQRLSNFGSYGSFTAENITYFPLSPREIVITMIIDDGVKSRSHRKNIFSENFKHVGPAFGKGLKGENLCVLIFADIFKEAGKIPQDKRLTSF